MGIDRDFATAFAKSQLGAGTILPEERRAVRLRQGQRQAGRSCRACARWPSSASRSSRPAGTADYLAEQASPVERVNKVAQGRPHIVDRIKDGGIDLIFNTTEGWQSLKDSHADPRARRSRRRFRTSPPPPASVEAAQAIVALSTRSLEVARCKPIIRTRTINPHIENKVRAGPGGSANRGDFEDEGR